MSEALTMTTAEVAEMLEVDRFAVRRLVDAGELYPLGRVALGRGRPTMVFSREAIVEYELAHRPDRDRVKALATAWRAAGT